MINDALRPALPAVRLKVLFVINGLDIGGAEQQLTELLLRIDRRRFEPVVCCLGRRGPLADVLERAAVHVKVIGLRRLNDSRLGDAIDILRRVWRFVRFVFAERPHVVVGLLFWAYIFTTFTASAARVPVILSTRLSLGLFKVDRPGLRLIERVANRLTDLVIANGEAVRVDAIRQERLPPEKIIVIRNGIDARRFDLPFDRRFRRELGVRTDGPVVAVIANMLASKGHGVFLEAWKSVMSRHPKAAALLVGDGPLRAELEARAAADGAAFSIIFLGTRRDVPQVLSAVDIVAHPSLEEGSANAILEAMAAAKPVIATAVGGNVEAVVHERTGLLVPPSDAAALAKAICWLIENPDNACALGRAGRQRVADRYDMDAMVRAYEGVFLDQWRQVAQSRAHVASHQP